MPVLPSDGKHIVSVSGAGDWWVMFLVVISGSFRIGSTSCSYEAVTAIKEILVAKVVAVDNLAVVIVVVVVVVANIVVVVVVAVVVDTSSYSSSKIDRNN